MSQNPAEEIIAMLFGPGARIERSHIELQKKGDRLALGLLLEGDDPSDAVESLLYGAMLLTLTVKKEKSTLDETIMALDNIWLLVKTRMLESLMESRKTILELKEKHKNEPNVLAQLPDEGAGLSASYCGVMVERHWGQIVAPIDHTQLSTAFDRHRQLLRAVSKLDETPKERNAAH